MSDLPKASDTRPVLHALDLIVISVVCLGGAALAAFVPGFFISDMVGDWYEMYGPEGPGQTTPSYWAENGSFGLALGLILVFAPAALLVGLALRFFYRALELFVRFVSPASSGPPSA